MFISSMASLSTFHPEANPALNSTPLFQRTHPESPFTLLNRQKHLVRILGKASTLAANAYRHRLGRTYNPPMPDSLDYVENVFYMMDRLTE